MKKNVGITVSILLSILLLSACVTTAGAQNESFPEAAPDSEDAAPYWCAIELTEPSEKNIPMPPGREFYINGKFRSNGKLPEGAALSVSLFDEDGNIVEYVEQRIKDYNNYLIDPKLAERNGVTSEELLKIAEITHMPELFYDGKNPESFNDPKLKCWFDDDSFKAVMQAVPEGHYHILAELVDAENHILAKGTDEIEVRIPDNALLARFHPDAHAANMYEWSFENGYSVNYDYIPGFFPGVNGNSGAKSLNFIKSDCAIYNGSHTRMFVYMIDPESSSYTLELPFLFSKGYIDDPEMFTAYHYDIGEAELSSELHTAKGTIVGFETNDHHDICRVDIVNEKAKENEFDLQVPCYNGFDILPDDGAAVPSGRRFAIMGVLSPQTLDDDLIHNKDTGLYSINNRVEKIAYTISKDGCVFEAVKPVFLKRTGVDETDETYGSVYEYYHIFDTDGYENGTWMINSYGMDKNGTIVDGTGEKLFITIE